MIVSDKSEIVKIEAPIIEFTTLPIPPVSA
jgi:hypothetical protein